MTYQNHDNLGCGAAITGYCTAVALVAVLGPLAFGGVAYLRTKLNPEVKIESYDIGLGHAKIKFAKKTNPTTTEKGDSLESKIEKDNPVFAPSSEVDNGDGIYSSLGYYTCE